MSLSEKSFLILIAFCRAATIAGSLSAIYRLLSHPTIYSAVCWWCKSVQHSKTLSALLICISGAEGCCQTTRNRRCTWVSTSAKHHQIKSVWTHFSYVSSTPVDSVIYHTAAGEYRTVCRRPISRRQWPHGRFSVKFHSYSIRFGVSRCCFFPNMASLW